jgi:hypothetical protein
MTTKQDYIGSILQSLATITISEPHPEFLAAIDAALGKFCHEIDPKGHNHATVTSPDDAIEILTAFPWNATDDEAHYCFDDKSHDWEH